MPTDAYEYPCCDRIDPLSRETHTDGSPAKAFTAAHLDETTAALSMDIYILRSIQDDTVTVKDLRQTALFNYCANLNCTYVIMHAA